MMYVNLGCAIIFCFGFIVESVVFIEDRGLPFLVFACLFFVFMVRSILEFHKRRTSLR